MPRLAQLEVAGGGERRRDARSSRARAGPAPAAGRAPRRRRGSTRKSPAAARNAIGERQQDAEDLLASASSSATMSLLISTVAIGSRNRLAPLADAPCTMPGIAALCSARTISTKRPWRLGDHLLLQVLGGVAAPANCSSVVRSFGPLPAQPLANRRRAPGWRRRDLAVDVDGAAHRRRPRRRTARARPTSRCRIGKPPGARATAACASAIEATKSARMRSCSASSGRPSTARPSSAASRPGPGAQREHAVLLDVARPSRSWRPAPARRRRDRSAAARPASAPCRRRQREAGERVDDAVEFEGGGLMRAGTAAVELLAASEGLASVHRGR